MHNMEKAVAIATEQNDRFMRARTLSFLDGHRLFEGRYAETLEQSLGQERFAAAWRRGKERAWLPHRRSWKC